MCLFLFLIYVWISMPVFSTENIWMSKIFIMREYMKRVFFNLQWNTRTQFYQKWHRVTRQSV
jgi:hypothetical protein